MIRYFVGHPTIANLTMVLLIVVGAIALPHLLRETFPRIAPHEVEIAISYPGATPETVSRDICEPVQTALDGLRHLVETRCDAFDNRALAIAKMRRGKDFSRFTADVEAEIRAIENLPETADTPVIRQLGREDLVAVVALTAPETTTSSDLKALADSLKTQMLRRGGIPKIEIAGFSDPEIRIEIEEDAVRALGLSLEEIAQAIDRQSVDLPLGEIRAPDGMTVLRFSDERRAVDAYRDLVLAANAAGGEVRLMDVARIVETVADSDIAVELNGAPAAILHILKDETDDTLRVMATVRAFVADTNARLPPSVALTITGDTAGVLNDRLQMLIKNSLQGLALVFLIMWIFLGARQAFWISAGLPVAFFGAFAAMVVMGYSINMLTLVALLIVIGILMDDALVIAENIETKRALGLSPHEAAVAGAREVASGVIASFTTTSAVFGSLAFLDGDLGEILRVVPIVMLIVLAISLVEAFLILPAHMSHGAPDKPDGPRLATRWLDRTRRRIVGPIVRASIRWRWLTLGITVLVFCASLTAILDGRLKFQAFPEIDGDQIQARVALPAGSPVAQTKAEMAYVLDRLEHVNTVLSPRNPGGAPLVRDITVSYGENADIGGTGGHLATARIDLLDIERRGASLDEILALWRAETPMTPAMARLRLTEGVIGPAGRAIEVRLAHDDLDKLKVTSRTLRTWLGRHAGVHNIADDLEAGRPELRYRLRDDAQALGLDAQTVANQVRAGFQGATAHVMQSGGESWDINVQLADADRRSIRDIANFTIKTPDGQRVPLEVIAAVEQHRGHAVLREVDARPVVTITADIDTAKGNADEIMRAARRSILPSLEAKHPDLIVELKGAKAAADKTQASMIAGLIVGLLIIFAVLSIQLRSYAEPLVVMAIIPFAFLGAIAGHMMLGIDLSMPSLLGFASLTGIVVNDSILVVHVIKAERAAGSGAADSAVTAALARFRAILLTSITTVAGMTPLLFETSLQAQPLIPMVTSIAFGLAATTVLIVVVIPAFYNALDDLGATASGLENRSDPPREMFRTGPPTRRNSTMC